MMTVPVNPGRRIDVDARGVPEEHNQLDESRPVVERLVSDAHVDDV
jgi:hypothetical protein